jgi:uncharacterized protein
MIEALAKLLGSPTFWEGLGIGTLGGFLSGLLGVSAGGILVPSLGIFLGMGQHQSQAVSLVAMQLPTGLPGVLQYHGAGHTLSWRGVAWLSGGFLLGSFLGARIAEEIAGPVLRWMFMGYLAMMAAIVFLHDRRQSHDSASEAAGGDDRPGLLLGAVGIFAGISSGLLGIGGGLAMIAGLAGFLSVPQHTAQALSLAVSALPAGLPGAWVYVSADSEFPWLLAAGIVAGLVPGTLLGARTATLLRARWLRYLLLMLIVFLIVLMIVKMR